MAVAEVYQGGCHCGAVRFEIRLPAPVGYLTECDCSVCTKKGILHLAAETDQFTVLKGGDALTLYQFGSRTAKHWFCRHCGIHVYGRPRNHPGRYTVNARCLDEFERVDAAAERRRFDGKNHPKDRPAAD